MIIKTQTIYLRLASVSVSLSFTGLSLRFVFKGSQMEDYQRKILDTLGSTKSCSRLLFAADTVSNSFKFCILFNNNFFFHQKVILEKKIHQLSHVMRKPVFSHKNPKSSDTRKIAVIILKFEQCGSTIE